MFPHSNYHSHSQYCDGVGTPGDYVLQALEERLVSMGFSSHAPLPFSCNWCMQAEQLTAYLNEIEDLQEVYGSQIEIYKGLEIDFIPGKISPAMVEWDTMLDYTIGSVHFVDVLDTGEDWEIDGSPQVFQRGLYELFGGDMDRVWVRYQELTRQMIREATPTLVGHIDKIKIQSRPEYRFNESGEVFKDELLKTLEEIAGRKNIWVELNTRGLYKKKSLETYPSFWVLQQMQQMGIPVVVNSDAHHPAELVQMFDEAQALLIRAGYTGSYSLIGGQWVFCPFDGQ